MFAVYHQGTMLRLKSWDELHASGIETHDRKSSKLALNRGVRSFETVKPEHARGMEPSIV